jgi:hypothetical protein
MSEYESDSDPHNNELTTANLLERIDILNKTIALDHKAQREALLLICSLMDKIYEGASTRL